MWKWAGMKKGVLEEKTNLCLSLEGNFKWTNYKVISLILRLGNFIVKPWQHLVAKVMIEARTSTLLPY